MLNLLERHDDKWRDGSGEERYEVELEDGTVETERTKDDVKAILFRHYRWDCSTASPPGSVRVTRTRASPMGPTRTRRARRNRDSTPRT
ncbi:hypothetical protein BRC63_01530 [Halobacteriales archaeon QH_10_70_21]|nr:MAG: hypothetical protein BRC63_01530 [Halobacteriales archaeon QH_10_70_21]